ncbi:MAG: thioesterase family protein [Parvibaculum sp.]|uniref:thioesterase family protein n=1 Tax=Parvibaculum sp. TaxID=2024848 RepID=UPI003C74EE50
MIECYRGTANSWECDENDHLNVRFFLDKAAQASEHLLHATGFGRARRAASGLEAHTSDRHIRYHQEQRRGAGVYIVSGILFATPGSLRILHEMRSIRSDKLAATFVETVNCVIAANAQPAEWPSDLLERASRFTVEMSANAAPRGVELAPPRAMPTLDEATSLNMPQIYRGIVDESQCGRNGLAPARLYLGIIADAIPRFGPAAVASSEKPKARMGSAVLEQRLVHRGILQANDLVICHAGVKAVTEKTMRTIIWLFNVETGDCLLSVDSIAINLDLERRRAVAMPEDRLTFMKSIALPSLAV